jgi:glycosyltransferase involved in cell wall biosynthesis
MVDKGVHVFLEAARRLRGPDYRFVLVGPRSLGQDALYHHVTRAHDSGDIDYRGELQQDELAEAYRQSHIFTLPTYYGEGLPRVMLEAGCGLMTPVASSISAHRDLIAPGRGVLLPARNEIESLVVQLTRLNSNRDELERSARAYQQHILTHYTMDHYTARMDDLLRELLTSPASASARRAA